MGQGSTLLMAEGEGILYIETAKGVLSICLNTWSTQQHYVGTNRKRIICRHKNKVKAIQHSFKKLYFIDYAISVVPVFPPVPPSTQHPPVPQAKPLLLFMSVGHEY